MTTDIITYTLRTIAVTEHQWISMTATTMEDDSIPSVEEARRTNLRAIHKSIAIPPSMDLGVPSTWREPFADMKVTVSDSIIKQDLMTGAALEERELERYTVSYGSMNPEEN